MGKISEHKKRILAKVDKGIPMRTSIQEQMENQPSQCESRNLGNHKRSKFASINTPGSIHLGLG